MYLLPCDECDQPISVTASKAGQQISCPQCGAEVVVPKLGELKRLQVPQGGQSRAADGSTNPSNVGPPDNVASGSSIVFVTLAFLATACLIIAFYCGIRWFLIKVPTTTEQHIATTTAAMKEASAAQLIVEYESLEKFGIDVASPFPYQVTANTKAKWGLNALVAASLGGVAVLGAGLSAKKR
jgi:DNA-directed RNA polymerase subunit RPC12/RpoP